MSCYIQKLLCLQIKISWGRLSRALLVKGKKRVINGVKGMPDDSRWLISRFIVPYNILFPHHVHMCNNHITGCATSSKANETRTRHATTSLLLHTKRKFTCFSFSWLIYNSSLSAITIYSDLRVFEYTEFVASELDAGSACTANHQSQLGQGDAQY